MKALILVGGLGTRLQPLTDSIPKPMAPVEGKPFLQYQIEWLKMQGITEIVLLTGQMADKIEQHFGDGSRFGVKISYSEEPKPLGTGGALKLAQRFVDGTFIAMNGDCHFQIDLKRLVEFHKKKGSQATLALARADDVGRYGFVEVDSDGKIIRYIEKGSSAKSAKGTDTISAGIYVLEPRIFDMVPEGPASFEYDVVSKINESYGLCFDDYFVDIGTHKSYAEFKGYMKRLFSEAD